MGVLERNHVRVTGTAGAPPLVFAHGYGCDQAMWRLVTPAFVDRATVVTYDHVGFGGSDPAAFDPVRHATLQGYAEDLLEVCDALALGPVSFVGHSVAAMIGVRAAVMRPEAFDRLVLVCPSPRYVDDTDGYVGGFSEADVDDLLTSVDQNLLGWSQTMAPVIMGVPERPELGDELTASFCRTDPRVASVFARVTFTSDSRADLPQITAPTLVLQSREDVIAGPAVGAYVRDAVPGAEMVVLDAVGHCPNLSAPAETAAAIAAFLRTP